MNTNSNRMLTHISLFLSFMGFYLCVLTYHPALMGAYAFMGAVQSEERGMMSYMVLGIFLVVSVLNLSSIIKSISLYPIVRVYIISILFSLLFVPMNPGMFFWDTYKISYPFIILLLGLSIPFNSKMLRLYMTVFILLSLYVGFINMRGLGITLDNFGGAYLMKYKNALCVVLGGASLVSLFFAFTTRIYPLVFIYLGFYAVGVIEIAMSRGRAALLAILCCTVVLIFKKFYTRLRQDITLTLILLAAMLVLLGVGLFYFDGIEFIRISFMGGRENYYDLDSLSANRIGLAKMALANFISNPILGESYRAVEGLNVHNYWLRMLSNYGLIGGFPYLLIYFYIAVIVLKGIFFNKVKIAANDFGDIGFYTCGLIYIASQFEVSIPFGPGTMSAIFFFLLGYSLRNNLQVSLAPTISPLPHNLPTMQNVPPPMMMRRY